MPQSLAVVYLHLVYATKERRPFLRDPDMRATVHAYLGASSRTLECTPVRVGGTEDHVHLLARFNRMITLSAWVKELKRITSIWIHGEYESMADFAWQGGYGCFSVSPSNLDEVIAYIENQEEHHRHMTFQEEFRALCKKHGIEIDERYVWD